MATATVLTPVSTAPAASLLDRMKTGDEEAFNELYKENYRRVLYAIQRIINEIDTAEFIANGVFAKVWEVRNSPTAFRGDSSFSTWITRIAITSALMHIRRLKAERSYATISLDAPIQSEDEESCLWPELSVRDFQLEGVADRMVLAKAIEQLPPALRQVFVYRHVQGFTTEETGTALNLRKPLVKSRLRNSQNKLREILSARRNLSSN